jgi:hypothetical protein
LIYGGLFLSSIYYCLSEFLYAAERMSELELEHFSVREFLLSKQITELEHPPHSPDLAPMT